MNKCQCQNGAVCDPKDGSCTCAAGWRGTSCAYKCEYGWGFGCKNNYTCIMNNTLSVNHVTGQCTCLPGFVGAK